MQELSVREKVAVLWWHLKREARLRLGVWWDCDAWAIWTIATDVLLLVAILIWLYLEGRL